MVLAWLVMATNAFAQANLGQSMTAIEWLGEPERRLHAHIADLLEVETAAVGQPNSKRTTTWESQQFRIGDWNATTTFHVVDGRVKRMLQEAVAPQQFCAESSDWGPVGLELREALDAAPMVYAPTMVSGVWQQAALWHVKRLTVVLYRTLVVDGECRVRMTVQ